MFLCPTMQWLVRIPILSVPPHPQERKGGTQTLRFVQHFLLGQNVRVPSGRDLSGQVHPLWIRERSDGAQFSCPPLQLSMEQEREQMGREVGLSAVPLGGQQRGRAGDAMRCRQDLLPVPDPGQTPSRHSSTAGSCGGSLEASQAHNSGWRGWSR